MANPYKNCEIKQIRFKQGEYKQLVNALDSNDKEKVLDIIFAIYLRKDIL